MLASQESVLRSQPSEADYRAATVKQRPTSRRITPAEISVSAPTHRKLADIICYHADIYSELIWHITYSATWTAKLYATRQTCSHALICSIVFLVLCIQLGWSFGVIKSSVGFVVIQSLFERQGMILHGGGLHPGIERGHIPLPKGMSRTKSFGKTITHPVHVQIRWMIVYLKYSMHLGNILKPSEYQMRKFHFFFNEMYHYSRKNGT